MPKLTTQQRTELETEREFLVRSLDDLEAERADGGIDEVTYSTLHSDYTARTATVLRALASDTAPKAPEGKRPPVRRGRRWTIVAAILAFAGIAAFSLAQSSGTRAPGGLPTGGVTTPSVSSNSYEGHLQRAAQFRAEDIADQATKEYLAAANLRPKSPEPITDLADMLLVRFISGVDNNTSLVTNASQLIDKAFTLDPHYGPAFFDEGILLRFDKKPVAESVNAFNEYLKLDPKGEHVGDAQSFIQQLTTPSTSTTTSPTTTP
ncbi:MAG TPA: hypothetical protein VGI86_13615 [Acidimicrobiia bacterium]